MKCQDCGTDYRDDWIARCPKCGAKPTYGPPNAKSYVILGVIGTLLALVVLAAIMEGCTSSSSTALKLYEEGRVLADSNRPEAIRKMSAAVSLAPDVPRYRHGLGVVLARAGLFQQARAELEVAVRIDPGNIEARRALEVVDQNLAAAQTDRLREALHR